MEAIAGYVFRLVCGALVCGMILGLMGPAGAAGRLVKRICGLFLAFLALSPLRNMELEDLQLLDPALGLQAQQFAQAGSDQAKEAMADIIKEECSAYIQNKAAELSLNLEIQVTLDHDSGVPTQVTLWGDATPYERETLCDYITQTLGLERGNIRWN